MVQRVFRRGLVWCLVAVVLLPVAIAVLLGLGGLLRALGDTAAAVVCGRVALAIAVLFVTALVATTALNALAILAPPPPPRRRPRRKGRRRRRVAPPEQTLGPS